MPFPKWGGTFFQHENCANYGHISNLKDFDQNIPMAKTDDEANPGMMTVPNIPTEGSKV